MNVKTLVAALLLAGCIPLEARAQTSYAPVPPAAVTAGGGDAGAATGSAPQTVGNSRWIAHTATLCGGDGVSPPIGSEIYIYSGASIPFGSQYLGDVLQPGWMIGGGLRTLFFNQDMDAAWVVDAGLSHYNNRGDHSKRFPLRVLDFTGNIGPDGQPEVKLIQFGTPIRPGLDIRDTDRTFVSLGVGRDWYLRRPADMEDARKWRIGIDAGGRYGTMSQEYDIIKHRTDVIGGFYAGIHQDLELPSKWGILVIGSRWEYAYTWSDILQHVSDIQEVNLMVTVGFRY